MENGSQVSGLSFDVDDGALRRRWKALETRGGKGEIGIEV